MNNNGLTVLKFGIVTSLIFSIFITNQSSAEAASGWLNNNKHPLLTYDVVFQQLGDLEILKYYNCGKLEALLELNEETNWTNQFHLYALLQEVRTFEKMQDFIDFWLKSTFSSRLREKTYFNSVVREARQNITEIKNKLLENGIQ